MAKYIINKKLYDTEKSIYEGDDVICKEPWDRRIIEGYSAAFCKCGQVLHIKTPRRKDFHKIKCPKCGFIINLFCGEESEIKRYDMHDDDDDDDDVVKALKCCISDAGSCDGCPLEDVQMCGRELHLNTLDLIERQKAEIEKSLPYDFLLLTCPICGGEADFVSGRMIECKGCGAKFNVENIIANIELKGEGK